MFESAELGHKIKKTAYEKEVPALREALLDAQLDLASSAKFQVIILVGAWMAPVAGQRSICSTNEWIYAIFRPTAWANLPMKNLIGR